MVALTQYSLKYTWLPQILVCRGHIQRALSNTPVPKKCLSETFGSERSLPLPSSGGGVAKVIWSKELMLDKGHPYHLSNFTHKSD